jgi:hypothetical protein
MIARVEMMQANAREGTYSEVKPRSDQHRIYIRGPKAWYRRVRVGLTLDGFKLPSIAGPPIKFHQTNPAFNAPNGLTLVPNANSTVDPTYLPNEANLAYKEEEGLWVSGWARRSWPERVRKAKRGSVEAERRAPGEGERMYRREERRAREGEELRRRVRLGREWKKGRLISFVYAYLSVVYGKTLLVKGDRSSNTRDPTSDHPSEHQPLDLRPSLPPKELDSLSHTSQDFDPTPSERRFLLVPIPSLHGHTNEPKNVPSHEGVEEGRAREECVWGGVEEGEVGGGQLEEGGEEEAVEEGESYEGGDRSGGEEAIHGRRGWWTVARKEVAMGTSANAEEVFKNVISWLSRQVMMESNTHG